MSVRSVLLPLVLAVVASGCTAHSADLTEGSFRAYLASSTSTTLYEGDVDLDGGGPDWKHYAIDCRTLVEDPEEELSAGEVRERLDGALEICDDPDPDDDVDHIWPPQHELWLELDGYEVLTDKLDPWRGEAIMTSEGDLQITFHHWLPGYRQDFRFAFVVDPTFQPTVCGLDQGGNPQLQQDDGDWLANWAKDTEPPDDSLFYLNAGSYQFNPSNLDDLWILPEQWLAGFAAAQFASEDFYSRSVRFGQPDAYLAFEIDSYDPPSAADLFYEVLEPDIDPISDTGFVELVEEVGVIADETAVELALTDPNGETWYTPMVHDNAWRTPDGTAAGLDAWVELQYNWVRFDQKPADLVVGSPASGEFSLVMGATSSQSRLFIEGSFTVDKIKKDHYTVVDITEDRLAENGTVICGGGEPVAAD
jgi:hypothetical protein